MRTKRRTIAITLLTLVVLIIAALAYALLSEKQIPEPSYNGKSLSEWMEIYRMAPVLSDSRTEPANTKAERVAAFRAREARVAGIRAEVQLAVRAIGTDALPYLLQCFRYELPPWRQHLLKLATRPVEGKTLDEGKIVYGASFIVGPTARRAELADLGFVILSTNAAPVIPELEAMMKDNQKPDRALRAIFALGEIGGPAIVALTNALADTNQTNRCKIIEALYTVELMSPFYYGGTYRGACLPALNRALDDPDAEVRRQARVTLYNLSLDQITRVNLAFRGFPTQPLTNAPTK